MRLHAVQAEHYRESSRQRMSAPKERLREVWSGGGDVITGRNQKAPGSSCASHPDLGETQTPEVSSAEILSPYGQPIPAMEECERNHPDTRK